MLTKFLNEQTMQSASKLFGSLEALMANRVFHCVNVYLKDYDKYEWCLITNRSQAPTIKEDTFGLMFLRSLCDGILNSGKNMRLEREEYHQLYNFKDHKDLEPLFKRANMKIYQLDKIITPTCDKKFVMLSKNAEIKDLFETPFFKLPYFSKTLMTTESNSAKMDNELLVNQKYKNFFTKHKIQIKQEYSPSIRSTLNFMRKELECKRVLIEMGQTMNKIYEQENLEDIPVDCLVISLMKGIIGKNCIGPRFIKMDSLLKNFRLSYESPSLTDDFSNKWRFMVLERKKSSSKGSNSSVLPEKPSKNDNWKSVLTK